MPLRDGRVGVWCAISAATLSSSFSGTLCTQASMLPNSDTIS